MKKFFLFVLISIILVSIVFPEQYDIRKLRWGMSFEEVQRVEGLENNLYKAEELLGQKVEVFFGCDNKGLYSVAYSTKEKMFAGEARQVMIKKYGEAKSDLDYSHLIKVQNILEKHPNAVVPALDKGNYSELDNLKSADSILNEKKVIRNALIKRDMWQFGNTVALLLDSYEGAALTYWNKSYHLENKKKFEAFLIELRKKVTKSPKKEKDESEKF